VLSMRFLLHSFEPSRVIRVSSRLHHWLHRAKRAGWSRERLHFVESLERQGSLHNDETSFLSRESARALSLLRGKALGYSCRGVLHCSQRRFDAHIRSLLRRWGNQTGRANAGHDAAWLATLQTRRHFAVRSLKMVRVHRDSFESTIRMVYTWRRRQQGEKLIKKHRNQWRKIEVAHTQQRGTAIFMDIFRRWGVGVVAACLSQWRRGYLGEEASTLASNLHLAGMRNFRTAVWSLFGRPCVPRALSTWSYNHRSHMDSTREAVDARRPEAARRFYRGVVAGAKIAAVLRQKQVAAVAHGVLGWKEGWIRHAGVVAREALVDKSKAMVASVSRDMQQSNQRAKKKRDDVLHATIERHEADLSSARSELESLLVA